MPVVCRLHRALSVSLAALLWVLAGASSSWAQAPGGGVGLGSEQRPDQVIIAPLYKYIDDAGVQVEQLSTNVQLVLPFSQRWTARIQSSYARSLGRGLDNVDGLDDTEVSLSYAQPIGATSLLFNLGAGLPSGKQELSGEAQPAGGVTGELGTTTLTSQDFYDFAVGSYGEGLALAPSIAFAFPAGDIASFGLGFTYRYRATYRPVAGVGNEYDPGDELVLTAGASLGPTPNFVLSFDITYTHYARDQLSGFDAIQAGDQVALTTQVVQRFDGGSLSFTGRYESQARSSVPEPGVGLAEQTFVDQQIIPQQGFLQLGGRARLGSWLTLTPEAVLRFFGATDGQAFQTDPKTVFVGRLTPEVRFSDGFALGVTGGLTAGSFSGYEVGTRLVFSR